MPSTPRPGSKGIYVELPERLLELVRERAKTDRRKLKDTLVLAIEQYLGIGPDQYATPPEPPPAKKTRKTK